MLALDEGQFLGEKGYENQAILWVARSIKLAPSEVGLYRPLARTNYEAWERRVHPLRMIFPRQSGTPRRGIQPQWPLRTHRHRGSGHPAVGPGNRGFQRSAAGGATNRRSVDGGRIPSRGRASSHRQPGRAGGTPRYDKWEKNVGACPLETLSWAVRSAWTASLLAWPAGKAPDARRRTGPPPKRSLVRLLKAADGQATCPPIDCPGSAIALGFSPDSSCMALASGIPGVVDEKGLLSVHDLNGHAVGNPIELPNAALAVEFSPDGKRIMTGHWDYTARLWDRDSGKNRLTFQHEGPVGGVRFSVNGTTLLSGSYDGTVRLWDRTRGGRWVPH